MKTILLNFILSIFSLGALGQGIQLKNGDQFPNLLIENILNAPINSVNMNKLADQKLYILNFWGTWCSPCIPEMDSLAKLQNANSKDLQVIAISDEDPVRLLNYLKKKPSKIWLTSDPSAFLYQLFGLAYVGQSAIINAKGKIVTLVKTDSINQKMINKLIKGELVKQSAEVKEKPVNNSEDLFAVDSTLTKNFTLRGYMAGQQSMTRGYGPENVFGNRRITFVNSSAEAMFRAAYHITSLKQIVYEIPEKEVSDFENKTSLFCLDLLVEPTQKDSLYQILQKRLQQEMPVKARIDYKEMPVYVLINKGFKQKESSKTVLSYSFSGKGYEGEGSSLADFATEYLSNEFDLPVVDETGLTKKYDIKTNVEMRDRAGIMKSLSDIGLTIVEKSRKMKVLIFYK
jgi:uncharacterized protein (TIGR03435 family)